MQRGGRGEYADPIMFIQQLRRMMLSDRMSSLERQVLPPAPVPSPSLADLEKELAHATALPCPPCEPARRSRYRALDAAAMGHSFPASALMHRVVPSKLHHAVDQYQCRAYGGRFVGTDGARFVTSCQDKYIRVYETGHSECSRGWKRTHRIDAEYVRWTITDFDVSPCGRWLAYASINNYVHLVDLDNPTDEQLVLNLLTAGHDRMNIWSLMWGHNGRELIAGTGGIGGLAGGGGDVVVYDVHKGAIVDSIPAHDADVNSVCFMQRGEENLILSGSDDCLVKMWDRRELRSGRPGEIQQACGVFVGHHHGLTHVSTKNDGRFFLSNGKDQYIKLWDARKTTSTADLGRVRRPPRDTNFDYRFQTCPRVAVPSKGYQDDAVMSYAGAHETLQTLIRAHFSPIRTTGQKYIYCGSSDGAWVVYDVLTGNVVQRMRGHGTPVRDVSWHPEGCFVVTSSWDGQVLLWSTYTENEGEAGPSS